jgi:hypothetical protein
MGTGRWGCQLEAWPILHKWFSQLLIEHCCPLGRIGPVVFCGQLGFCVESDSCMGRLDCLGNLFL